MPIATAAATGGTSEASTDAAASGSFALTSLTDCTVAATANDVSVPVGSPNEITKGRGQLAPLLFLTLGYGSFARLKNN